MSSAVDVIIVLYLTYSSSYTYFNFTSATRWQILGRRPVICWLQLRPLYLLVSLWQYEQQIWKHCVSSYPDDSGLFLYDIDQ